jgi:two-component system chemotaxis sensor kinase CheA
VRTSAESDRPGATAHLSAGLDRMDRVVGELQLRALDLRTTPLMRIVEPLPRMARDVARHGGKTVEVEIRGGELELDRSILDRLSDPLVHLVRNAVDHGIEAPERRTAAGKPETGSVTIDARREKDAIRIAVIDDGAGMDLERVRRRAVEAGLVHPDIAEDLPADQLAAFVFHPGFSTAESVSEISGRGVGMDAVRVTLESLGGDVEFVTEAGRGTTTILTVPITAAVQRVLLLRLGDETVALPISRVERILEVSPDAIETSGREAFALIDDEPVPVLELAERLSLSPGERAANRSVTLVLTDVRGESLALRVDRVAGQQQIYVKPVPDLLTPVRALSGLTILGDGRPVFVLDTNQVV